MSAEQPENLAGGKPRSVPLSGAFARDLLPRVLSGIALAAVAFGLLYAGVVPFAVLVLGVTLAMCWEWGRVVRSGEPDAVLLVHGASVGGAVVLAASGYAALGLIALLGGTLVVTALRFGEKARMSALGVLYVGLPAISLLLLRGAGPHGFLGVLFVLVVVIATDTFAYVAGRLIGGPKLWPRVSPNKTWSGLAGGVAVAGTVGALFSQIVAGGAPLRMAALAIGLGVVAQGGDLAESALKRAFGVKDASSLIPGHGGFMDRMDGVVTAAPVAALIGLLVNMYAPARALLLGW